MTLGDRVVVMNDGVIQQCGPAEQVYHFPENRFVAGFLGNPSMNFIGGQLVEHDGQCFFERDAGRLLVPQWAKQQLGDRMGGELVLGVRPEALSDKRHASFETDGNCLDMQVKLTQPLGDRTNVHLALESESRVVAQLHAHARFDVGQTLPVYVDMQRALFFEPSDQGRTLAMNKAALPH